MTSDIKQRFKNMMQGSARLILAEYLKERIQEKTNLLVSCNESTFKHQQGRVHELQDLLKEIES